MKTLEDMEKEYGEHECRIYTINNLKELESWILVAFDDISENIKVLRIDYRNNKDCKTMGIIRNLLPFLFEYEDVTFYDKDNKLIYEAYLVNRMYENYFKQILHYSTEENCGEMAKLADFIMMHYDIDCDYIDNERDVLEYQRKGYGYIGNNCEDNSEVVHDFFIEKINELSNVKGIEKVKKM